MRGRLDAGNGTFGEETDRPRGVWPHALARAATFPDAIFEMLRSKPSLVPSEDTEGTEAAKDTGIPKKRKYGTVTSES
jgi:hypothetical protein